MSIRACRLFHGLAGLAIIGTLVALVGVGPGAARTGTDVLESRSLLGSYLAGRIARGQHDAVAAAEFYKSALDREPDNAALVEQALLMAATEGRFDLAVDLAGRLKSLAPDHRVTRLVLGLAAVKKGDFASAEKDFTAPGNGVMENLTLTMARAWMRVAQNDIAGAIALADGVKQAEWAKFYVRYHKALMYDVAGDTQQARANFESLFRSDMKSFRVALAYASHASAAGDNTLGMAILDEHARKSAGTAHPVAADLSKSLAAGEKARLLVATPAEGVSEIFYGLGEALASEGGISVGAIYLQMAIYLRSDAPFALASLANVYETTKNYAAAIDAYNRIPKGSPLELAIDVRKAQNLNLLDRVDEAKAILDDLVAKDPNDIQPLDALGTLMRGRKRYDEAIGYYTKVIGLIGTPERRHWTHFYARGTSYERTKQWSLAEADLQKAMQLAPDQPLVLNYLGYSWVDQGLNLQRGLKLIEKAVQLKPDDGYIVDSLGWAHYRLGNFKQAVKALERAVELRPEDPTLNDHLGDAFWRVGRRREAVFQWEQAMTLKPEPEDAEKIKAKISQGLPELPRAKTAKGRKSSVVRKAGPRNRAANGTPTTAFPDFQ